MAADASVPGFRCGTGGRLVLDARECRGEGDAVAVVDVVDDAIEDALGQRVEVNVDLRARGGRAHRRPRRPAAVPVTPAAVLFDAGNTLVFLDYARLAAGGR